jgi:hypothetical protein
MVITFTHSSNTTFSVLAKVDALPSALIDYDQYWTSSEETWGLIISGTVAARISYVGIALVNRGGAATSFRLFVRLEAVELPTQSEPPTAPADNYLTMVVAYVLVGIALPIGAVLGLCLWIAKRRGHVNP